MTEYKPGDRVKVEFEAIYTGEIDDWIEFNGGDVNMIADAVDNLTITQIKPPVPTEFGSVVRLEGGERLVFDGTEWSGINFVGSSSTVAKLNFTVIREGI